jgi:hypothetical protein
LTTRLQDIAEKIRSKNAGPFWLTIDIFCGDFTRYERISRALTTERVAALYDTPSQNVKRFELPDLAVIKFSMPRPTIQGSRTDRDMHASQYGWLLAEMELTI